ncbi:cuticle protein AMP1A-like [Panulirus ornatus]|uniref:cuticle protein AMP1A-like n=1 Tax=Panulirus ornatus TaxID=150431 RepID=UPI003A87D2E7
MKLVIFVALAAVAAAAPRPDEEELISAESVEAVPAESLFVVPILRDERVHEEDGRYNVDVETGNGIVLSQSGSPNGPDGSMVMTGTYSYTAPDGTPVVVKFVADENGFQPQSDLLPVAPEFPHPIPQFVLDQIAFAAEQDARRARGDFSEEESDEVLVPTQSTLQ